MNRLFCNILAVAAVTIVSFPAYAQYATRGGYGGYGGGGFYCQGRNCAATNNTVNQNVTGAWPGSGPYDSMIAQQGIMAGAGILGKLIDKFGPQPEVRMVQPQQYVQPQVIVPSATREAVRQMDCRNTQIGYDMAGRPIFGRTC